MVSARSDADTVIHRHASNTEPILGSLSSKSKAAQTNRRTAVERTPHEEWETGGASDWLSSLSDWNGRSGWSAKSVTPDKLRPTTPC